MARTSPASASITNFPSESVAVPFVVPLIRTVAPGKGAPFSSLTVPGMGWETDTTGKEGSFIVKNTSLTISSEDAWDGLAQNPPKLINHAELHTSVDNRNFEYMIVSVVWLKFFGIYGF
jgi:hypothetical protein